MSAAGGDEARRVDAALRLHLADGRYATNGITNGESFSAAGGDEARRVDAALRLHLADGRYATNGITSGDRCRRRVGNGPGGLTRHSLAPVAGSRYASNGITRGESLSAAGGDEGRRVDAALGRHRGRVLPGGRLQNASQRLS
jgi:hypothetical protein